MGTRVLEWGRLPNLFPMFPESDRWLPILQAHAALIAEAAPAVRVTTVPPEEAIRRQYAESLEIGRILLEQGAIGAPSGAVRGQAGRGQLVDVGSGGGFPGLVLAAVFPGTEVHLVEPLQKRASLLVEFAAALKLENVTVYPLRAELAGRGVLRDSAGVVTARAVASLTELLEYTAPLCRTGGIIVLPKGSSLADEAAAAEGAAGALACEQIGRAAFRAEVSEHIACLIYRKSGPTPAAFPRRPGIPAKRPL